MADAIVDVVVVGAGPAGLLASLRAAERGARVLLLEKARKPGVKILISGGTRCNVANVADRDHMLRAFGGARRFLRPAFHAFFREEMLALLDAEGVPTKSEPTGKIFPVSDRALDVQQALVRRVRAAGVTLRTGVAVTAIAGDRTVRAGAESWSPAAVVLACGGASYPKVGTTGDGYGFARALGHTVVAPRPALVPLAIGGADREWVAALKGLAVPGARLRWLVDGRKQADGEGDLLFAHFGLTGPGPMNLSGGVDRAGEVELDVWPGLDEEALRARLIERGADGARAVSKVLAELPGAPPRRLLRALLARAEVAPEMRLAELGKRARNRLVTVCKRLRLACSGTMGFDRAEVTRGGIALAEVDPRTMESRRVPGLYLAGEVLDIDGPIGGYNFQAAFSTGWLAGDQLG